MAISVPRVDRAMKACLNCAWREVYSEGRELAITTYVAFTVFDTCQSIHPKVDQRVGLAKCDVRLGIIPRACNIFQTIFELALFANELWLLMTNMYRKPGM